MLSERSLLYRNRFFWLFLSIALLIVASPYMVRFTHGQWIMNAISYVILLTAVYSMVHQPRTFILGCVFGIIAFICNIINLTSGSVTTEIIRIFTALLFYAFISTAIFATILQGRKITAETVYAALCGYLFIGVTYAEIYHLIDVLQPNSFLITNNIPGILQVESYQFLYFSFTTLSTVGFGDIVAISPYAISFVILEEITGIFYMAVFVARLVAGLKFSD